MNNQIIAWWSGGITSAVACKKVIGLYGKDSCRCIFMDTYNEDDDTYRFLKDCEKWYGMEIESISMIGKEIKTRKGLITYTSIQDVWIKNLSLNVANGAICSSILKRDLRKEWQKHNTYKHQVFGFDVKEVNRAKSMSLNYPETNPIFPLLFYALSKKDCIKIVEDEGIEVPNAYKQGYSNNNCLKTFCIQGGIGYWQKIQRESLDKFVVMAAMEHHLTDLKGKPVTICKDQSKGGGLVFLLPHSNYPHVKDLSMMKGIEPEPLMECNGFCGLSDLEEQKSTKENISYQHELF